MPSKRKNPTPESIQATEKGQCTIVEVGMLNRIGIQISIYTLQFMSMHNISSCKHLNTRDGIVRIIQLMSAGSVEKLQDAH